MNSNFTAQTKNPSRYFDLHFATAKFWLVLNMMFRFLMRLSLLILSSFLILPRGARGIAMKSIRSDGLGGQGVRFFFQFILISIYTNKLYFIFYDFDSF